MVAMGEARVKQELLQELIKKLKLRMAFNWMQHAAQTSQLLKSLVSHTVVSNNFALMEAVANAWKQLLAGKHLREQQAHQYSVLSERMRFHEGELFPYCMYALTVLNSLYGLRFIVTSSRRNQVLHKNPQPMCDMCACA